MATKLQRFMLRAINIWPPFCGAGIRVRWRSDRAVDVEMKLRFQKRNFISTSTARSERQRTRIPAPQNGGQMLMARSMNRCSFVAMDCGVSDSENQVRQSRTMIDL